LPHERKEEPPHLRDGERQELTGHEAHVLVCCGARCFLFVRPPCRRR
jgi:hypothetical protein